MLVARIVFHGEPAKPTFRGSAPDPLNRFREIRSSNREAARLAILELERRLHLIRKVADDHRGERHTREVAQRKACELEDRIRAIKVALAASRADPDVAARIRERVSILMGATKMQFQKDKLEQLYWQSVSRDRRDKLYADWIDNARQVFAVANGWRVSNHFTIRLLASGKMHSGGSLVGYHEPTGCDHAEFFKKDRRPIAIVAHNYGGLGEGSDSLRLQAAADELGLVVQCAPARTAATWYSPNDTTMLVVTRPGVAVVWPTPAEMVRNAITHQRYWNAASIADAFQKTRGA